VCSDTDGHNLLGQHRRADELPLGGEPEVFDGDSKTGRLTPNAVIVSWTQVAAHAHNPTMIAGMLASDRS
jgi:hypothetical protein